MSPSQTFIADKLRHASDEQVKLMPTQPGSDLILIDDIATGEQWWMTGKQRDAELQRRLASTQCR